MNATKDSLKTSEQLMQMTAAAKTETDRTLLRHAIGLTRVYEDVREKLADMMDYCQGELERALRELRAEGRVPNSLGVLQANGVEVDRLCGELSRTRNAAEAAQELLATLGTGSNGYIDLSDAEQARHEAWMDDRPGPGERMPDGSHGEGNLTM